MSACSAIWENRFSPLALGALTAAVMHVLFFMMDGPGWAGAYTLKSLVRSLSSWFWLSAILGFGIRYLNFNNRVPRYTREAVLPFYILHQTVIVVIGHYRPMGHESAAEIRPAGRLVLRGHQRDLPSADQAVQGVAVSVRHEGVQLNRLTSFQRHHG